MDLCDADAGRALRASLDEPPWDQATENIPSFVEWEAVFVLHGVGCLLGRVVPAPCSTVNPYGRCSATDLRLTATYLLPFEFSFCCLVQVRCPGQGTMCLYQR